MIAVSNLSNNNQRIKERIDILLDSGVDLDQMSVLESETFSNLYKTNPQFSAILQRIAWYALENAKRIQKARELVLKIQ